MLTNCGKDGWAALVAIQRSKKSMTLEFRLVTMYAHDAVKQVGAMIGMRKSKRTPRIRMETGKALNERSVENLFLQFTLVGGP